MGLESITFSFFLILLGQQYWLHWRFIRDSLYWLPIVLGALLGPFGVCIYQQYRSIVGYFTYRYYLSVILLGLDMQPSNLYHMLKKATFVALISSAILLSLATVLP